MIVQKCKFRKTFFFYAFSSLVSCTIGRKKRLKYSERLNQSKIHILHVFQFSSPDEIVRAQTY